MSRSNNSFDELLEKIIYCEKMHPKTKKLDLYCYYEMLIGDHKELKELSVNLQNSILSWYTKTKGAPE
jgi:hypothetical protein